jgi:hypothetical protein
VRGLIPRPKKNQSEILVYKRNGAPFFHRAFLITSTCPVRLDPSRKQFFAKLLGLTAFAGFLPKMLAKSSVPAPATVAAPVTVRTESRAVARRADVL